MHGKFDGIFTQGGSTGTVRALMDAKHPFIPMAGEAENGYRKLIAQHSGDGLKGWSYGQSPGLVAISIKAAISALQGNVDAAADLGADPGRRLHDPQGRRRTTGRTCTDNFFAPNDFPPCGVNISAPEIMAKDAKNTQ